MLLLALADDNVNNDSGDYTAFCANYDLDNDGVFDNDDAGNGEEYAYMMVTYSWLPTKHEYDDDNILLLSGVFDVGDKPIIHPKFFNSTLKDNLGCSYINDDSISNTQVFNYALLKSLMRKKRGDTDNSIQHYDTILV